jgi:hypothetical protein
MDQAKLVPTYGCLHTHKSNGKAVVERGPPVTVSSRVSLHEYRKMTSLSPIGPAEFADDLSVQQLGKKESFMSILSQRLPQIKGSNRSLIQSMIASPDELRLAGVASPGAYNLRFSLDRQQPSVSTSNRIKLLPDLVSYRDLLCHVSRRYE